MSGAKLPYHIDTVTKSVKNERSHIYSVALLEPDDFRHVWYGQKKFLAVETLNDPSFA